MFNSYVTTFFFHEYDACDGVYGMGWDGMGWSRIFVHAIGGIGLRERFGVFCILGSGIGYLWDWMGGGKV